MKAIDPVAIILTTYFRPRNRCMACDTADARTACGSSFCYSCWEAINDDLIAEMAEGDAL